jgi:hypothetical protein
MAASASAASVSASATTAAMEASASTMEATASAMEAAGTTMKATPSETTSSSVESTTAKAACAPEGWSRPMEATVGTKCRMVKRATVLERGRIGSAHSIEG